MTRHEFISRLREALTGEIPPEEIEGNIRFYNNYIDQELQKGRSEAEIFGELGDPRLIARTIMETWQSDDTSLDDDGYGGGSNYSGGYSGYSDYAGYDSGGRGEYGSDSRSGRDRGGSGLKWYHKAIPVVIIALILFFILWVVTGVLRLTVSILLSPVFWIIVVALIVLGYLSRRR